VFVKYPRLDHLYHCGSSVLAERASGPTEGESCPSEPCKTNVNLTYAHANRGMSDAKIWAETLAIVTVVTVVVAATGR
jgi:hypothetical protein